MDDPVFGEETPTEKWGKRIAALLVFALVVTSVISAFVVGPEHVLLGIVVSLQFLQVVVLLSWYQKDQLDPKFRYLVAFLLVTLILTCSASLAYTYTEKPFMLQCLEESKATFCEVFLPGSGGGGISGGTTATNSGGGANAWKSQIECGCVESYKQECILNCTGRPFPSPLSNALHWPT